MLDLRNLVYDMLASDTQLNALGITAANLWPSPPDTPEGRTFMILRWGAEQVPPLRPVPVDGPTQMLLTVWSYDRDGGYDRITAQLRRVRAVIDSLVNQSTGSGWVIGVNWEGSSEDLRDDVYAADTRNETYRFVASGN